VKIFVAWILVFLSVGCSSTGNNVKTVEKVDLQKFMGDWYVLAGRLTYFEKDVHNGLESYTWNSKEDRIDASFTYNKGLFEGPLKSLPQKGWVYNQKTKSHWKVSPLWPFKFDYLIIA
jgi:apolipoprotein D and lipocalin family protein